MKKFWLTVCFIFCTLSFTACGSGDSDLMYEEETLVATAEFVINNLTQIDKESLQEMADIPLDSSEAQSLDSSLGQLGYAMSFEAFRSAVNAYLASSDELGAYVSTDDYTIVLGAKEITVIASASFEKRDAEFEFLFDQNSKMQSGTLNAKYSTGETMKKAALNTLLGMGTVFVMLILIALIISCFKFIPKIEAAFKKESAPASVEGAAATQKEITEDVVDDLELAAVISAAIAASEDIAQDDFVVRSIKRRKSNRW